MQSGSFSLTSSPVRVEKKKGCITVVSLCRPERRNAVDSETAAALAKLSRTLHVNPLSPTLLCSVSLFRFRRRGPHPSLCSCVFRETQQSVSWLRQGRWGQSSGSLRRRWSVLFWCRPQGVQVATNRLRSALARKTGVSLCVLVNIHPSVPARENRIGWRTTEMDRWDPREWFCQSPSSLLSLALLLPVCLLFSILLKRWRGFCADAC